MLMDEARALLSTSRIHSSNQIDGHIFRPLMSEGKVRSALNYPSHDRSRGC